MKSLVGHLLGDTRTAILAALLLRPAHPRTRAADRRLAGDAAPRADGARATAARPAAHAKLGRTAKDA